MTKKWKNPFSLARSNMQTRTHNVQTLMHDCTPTPTHRIHTLPHPPTYTHCEADHFLTQNRTFDINPTQNQTTENLAQCPHCHPQFPPFSVSLLKMLLTLPVYVSLLASLPWRFWIDRRRSHSLSHPRHPRRHHLHPHWQIWPAAPDHHCQSR